MHPSPFLSFMAFDVLIAIGANVFLLALIIVVSVAVYNYRSKFSECRATIATPYIAQSTTLSKGPVSVLPPEKRNPKGRNCILLL